MKEVKLGNMLSLNNDFNEEAAKGNVGRVGIRGLMVRLHVIFCVGSDKSKKRFVFGARLRKSRKGSLWWLQ